MEFKDFKKMYLAYPRLDKKSGYIRFYHASDRVNSKFNSMNITGEEYKSYLMKFNSELSEYYVNRK